MCAMCLRECMHMWRHKRIMHIFIRMIYFISPVQLFLLAMKNSQQRIQIRTIKWNEQYFLVQIIYHSSFTQQSFCDLRIIHSCTLHKLYLYMTIVFLFSLVLFVFVSHSNRNSRIAIDRRMERCCSFNWLNRHIHTYWIGEIWLKIKSAKNNFQLKWISSTYQNRLVISSTFSYIRTLGMT